MVADGDGAALRDNEAVGLTLGVGVAEPTTGDGETLGDVDTVAGDAKMLREGVVDALTDGDGVADAADEDGVALADAVAARALRETLGVFVAEAVTVAATDDDGVTLELGVLDGDVVAEGLTDRVVDLEELNENDGVSDGLPVADGDGGTQPVKMMEPSAPASPDPPAPLKEVEP